MGERQQKTGLDLPNNPLILNAKGLENSEQTGRAQTSIISLMAFRRVSLCDRAGASRFAGGDKKQRLEISSRE